MTWSLTNKSALIPIKLSNPFLETEYPFDGLVMAVLDTGFTGFLLVPSHVFNSLKLDELRPRVTTGQLADGTSIKLSGAYGILQIPELQFQVVLYLLENLFLGA